MMVSRRSTLPALIGEDTVTEGLLSAWHIRFESGSTGPCLAATRNSDLHRAHFGTQGVCAKVFLAPLTAVSTTVSGSPGMSS